ncbi:MAG: VOC family protein [Actinomycetota bacterium]
MAEPSPVDAADQLDQTFRTWRDDGSSEQAELGGRYGGAMGINHLVINVRDMDASHRFWTTIMRLEHCGTQGGPGQPRFLRFYRSHGNTHHDLALSPVAEPGDHPIPEGRPAGPGLNHLAWTYPDLDSWKAQVRHVVDTGYPIQFRMEHGMSQSLYVKDPDGTVIEMMYEYPEERWNRNIEAALQYRRVLDIDTDPDYFDPEPEAMPRFDERGLVP